MLLATELNEACLVFKTVETHRDSQHYNAVYRQQIHKIPKTF